VALTRALVERTALGPEDYLRLRFPRGWQVVASTTRRRDVRRRRSQLLLLLWSLRCPLRGRRRLPWYVPGAVARIGVEDMRSRWRAFYGEDPPSERTVRAHLGELERCLAIVRAPGDPLPTLFDDPVHRPRYPSTIHLLDTEADALFWQRELAARPERFEAARKSARAWRVAFTTWRRDARAQDRERAAGRGSLGDQLVFDFAKQVEGTWAARRTAEASTRRAVRAPVLAGIAAACARRSSGVELVLGLRRAGVRLRGRPADELARDPLRLRGAAAILGVALASSAHDVRNLAGFLVHAFRHRSGEERAAALELIRAYHGDPPHDRSRPGARDGPDP
jgi:hypothetical protein